MEVLRSSSVAAFLDLAGPYLEEREAEHNLIFGICSTIQADPTIYPNPYLATVLHGDRVVAAALRTPPWRLILSLVDHPGAVGRLVDDLADEALPGVVGPAESVSMFAEAWGRERRVPVELVRHERAFRLRQVIPPRPTSGAMELARPEHRRLLADWARAFHDEALAGGPLQDFDAMADRWTRGVGKTAYLWVDGGDVVSLTCVGGLTPRGIRIGPVYTPPDRRGRGYASALVARVSQLQLDSGREFVFLFTDLANPTSNKIYRDLGYEPVNDVDEWAFGAAQG